MKQDIGNLKHPPWNIDQWPPFWLTHFVHYSLFLQWIKNTNLYHIWTLKGSSYERKQCIRIQNVNFRPQSSLRRSGFETKQPI